MVQIIYLGQPDGPTCHTGAETCYYTSVPQVCISFSLSFCFTSQSPSLEMVLVQVASKGFEFTRIHFVGCGTEYYYSNLAFRCLGP